METFSYRKEGILSSRRRQKQTEKYIHTEQRRKGEKKTAWPVYGTIEHYGTAFSQEYERRGFTNISELFQERKAQEKPVRVLDFMGPGLCQENDSIDSITAVTLIDHTVESNISKRTCLEGDVFSPFSVRDGCWMALKNVAPFDVILSRPEGGLNVSAYPFRKEEGMEIWRVEFLQMYMRLRRLYEHMSGDDALAFFQMPAMIKSAMGNIREQLIFPWIESLQTLGVDISYTESTRDSFSLKKTKGTPQELPTAKKISLPNE
jgi:hypothetical protein